MISGSRNKRSATLRYSRVFRRRDLYVAGSQSQSPQLLGIISQMMALNLNGKEEKGRKARGELRERVTQRGGGAHVSPA